MTAPPSTPATPWCSPVHMNAPQAHAGWHGPENLSVPDGIRIVFQPAHSPELQPAEHLWAFVDEPLANCCFATIESLDQAVGDRCVALTQQPETIRDSSTGGQLSEQGSDQPESVITRIVCKGRRDWCADGQSQPIDWRG